MSKAVSLARPSRERSIALPPRSRAHDSTDFLIGPGANRGSVISIVESDTRVVVTVQPEVVPGPMGDASIGRSARSHRDKKNLPFGASQVVEPNSPWQELSPVHEVSRANRRNELYFLMTVPVGPAGSHR
ncbi:hypothetical protein KM043_002633 [Ampulex compressa]|nr:hypothetical protein KM043_002633 [Ampulex compressa]